MQPARRLSKRGATGGIAVAMFPAGSPMVDLRKYVTDIRIYLVLFLVALAGVVWLVHDATTGLPDSSRLQGMGAMAQATTLYDRNDHPAFTIFQEQRIEAPLQQISPHILHAVLAIEDQRFYDHGGIDVLRIAGAALNNVRERRAAQGGSTITQQLARQSFLTLDKTF